MNAPPTSRIAELSELLGVEVIDVRRDRPAHERPQMHMVGGAIRPVPARELDGVTVQRERWWVRIVDPSGRVYPRTGRTLTLCFRSEEVRSGRLLTRRLRDLGADVSVDNAGGRRALRLMHEVLEGAE